MEVDGREVWDRDQGGEIVGEKIVNGSFVALAPHGRGLHPVRAMHGRVFFEEVFLFYASGIALHGERPSGEMRHQIRRNGDVIIDDLSLGEPGGGIEDLVKVRETELAALHFDDGGSGHGGHWSFVAGRSLLPSSVGNNSEGPVHPERPATNDQRRFDYWFVASSSIVSRNRKKEIGCRVRVGSLFSEWVPSEPSLCFPATCFPLTAPSLNLFFTTETSGRSMRGGRERRRRRFRAESFVQSDRAAKSGSLRRATL